MQNVRGKRLSYLLIKHLYWQRLIFFNYIYLKLIVKFDNNEINAAETDKES